MTTKIVWAVTVYNELDKTNSIIFLEKTTEMIRYTQLLENFRGIEYSVSQWEIIPEINQNIGN